MGADNASERLRWTVDNLGLEPKSEVLEIGCGYGVAVSLVCERLSTGSILAIDRSRKMIDAATKRNRRFVDEGRAELEAIALEDAEFGRQFDLAFGAHVPVFLRGNPEKELVVLRRCLKKKSSLFLTSQPLDGRLDEQAAHICDALKIGNFRIDEVIKADISGGPIVGVRAKP